MAGWRWRRRVDFGKTGTTLGLPNGRLAYPEYERRAPPAANSRALLWLILALLAMLAAIGALSHG